MISRTCFGVVRSQGNLSGFLCCLALLVVLGFGASAQSPEITARFANPVFDCDTDMYSVDVEFQSNPDDPQDREIFGINLRFFFDSTVVQFISAGDFQGGYFLQGEPTVDMGVSESGAAFGFDSAAAYANVSIGNDLSAPPVFVAKQEWTKLFKVYFSVIGQNIVDENNFCPSMVWDLNANANNKGFTGSDGLVITVVNERGVSTAPATEQVVHCNWVSVESELPPYGYAEAEVCVSVDCSDANE